MPQNSPRKRRSGFSRHSLYPMAQPSYPALRYMKQKSSFWIAALSLIAFVSGNMIGQHGWYAFMASIWASGEDSMIAYEGVVAPVTKVPDYTKWAKYGGNAQEHTFREVPQDALVALPPYSALFLNDGSTVARLAQQAYSVHHAGGYTDDEGSHNGADIDTPTGTPIVAVGNGRIVKVSDDPGGFGLYVTIKLPNVPDPKNPKMTTDIYCTTAHMSAQLVVADQIVRKGDLIGYSGKTGFATGAHVHFQCDDKTAPYIPYSPFTGTDTREAKLSFTQAINSGFLRENIFTYSINPMAYVEANYPGAKGSTIVTKPGGTDVASADTSLTDPPQIKPVKKAVVLREERLQRRLSQRRILGNSIIVKPGISPLVTTGLIPVTTPQIEAPASSASSTSSATSSVEASSSSSVAATTSTVTPVSTIELSVPESFHGRAWETIRVTLLDAEGKKIARPSLSSDITIRAAYGMVEIRPQTLSALDFIDGQAKVQVLPRGTRTVVLEVMAPWNVLSKPIAFEE